jgi:hypothetical protein
VCDRAGDSFTPKPLRRFVCDNYVDQFLKTPRNYVYRFRQRVQVVPSEEADNLRTRMEKGLIARRSSTNRIY